MTGPQPRGLPQGLTQALSPSLPKRGPDNLPWSLPAPSEPHSHHLQPRTGHHPTHRSPDHRHAPAEVESGGLVCSLQCGRPKYPEASSTLSSALACFTASPRSVKVEGAVGRVLSASPLECRQKHRTGSLDKLLFCKKFLSRSPPASLLSGLIARGCGCGGFSVRHVQVSPARASLERRK